jgi:hypothetical protein
LHINTTAAGAKATPNMEDQANFAGYPAEVSMAALAGMLGRTSETTTGKYAEIVDKIAENPARYLEELMGFSQMKRAFQVVGPMGGCAGRISSSDEIPAGQEAESLLTGQTRSIESERASSGVSLHHSWTAKWTSIASTYLALAVVRLPRGNPSKRKSRTDDIFRPGQPLQFLRAF